MPKDTPLRVKLIAGLIYRDEDILLKTISTLKNRFGDTDFISPPITFTYTDYYSKEMGKDLKRRFISFRKLVKREEMVKIKLYTMKLEKKLSTGSRRRINIDPGYITLAKLVLLTRKDYFHRIYLGRGIFGEVTLYYKKGGFSEFPTTYPDYRTPEYKNILNKIRRIYYGQIKNERER